MSPDERQPRRSSRGPDPQASGLNISKRAAPQSGASLALPEREEKILEFWERNKIFEKTLAKTKRGKPFTFYDGPPFATGLPHYGHILASTIKDVIPRYQTMRGRFVRRRWGWDCHGLPVEEIVERKLGISGKKQIEKIGIQKFNATCRDTVLTYVQEWGKMIRRIARWVDFDHSYKTMDANYMESVWWAFKQIYGKGLVYEGRKVLLYCPRCETPVSKFEVAMDDSYETVTEEAITVKFTVKPGQKIGKWVVPPHTFILAWTTTPWTLVGNVALAVGKDISYSILELNTSGVRGLRNGGELMLAPGNYVVATERVPELTREGNYFSRTLLQISGRDLVGLAYSPLFEIPAVRSRKSYLVYPADFVTTEEGTGVVHTAIVYGEEDYELGVREGLPVVPLLDEKGKFNEKTPKFLQGVYFKDAEKLIKDDLAKHGLLFAREQHTHSYPYCWRCGTVLFYNAIPAWFINIHKIRRALLKSNAKEINWFPGHLKHGRYEKSVEQAPDWNISRNRYWGNPIPVWRCQKCKHQEVVGSLDEFDELDPAPTTLILMRHGEALHNVKNLMNPLPKNDRKNVLTERGRRAALAAAKRLEREQIDAIVTSPSFRAHETAKIVARELGIRKIETIRELNDIYVGGFEGQPIAKFRVFFANTQERFSKKPLGAENLREVRARMMAVVVAIREKYAGKRVLVVTHGDPSWVLMAAVEGLAETAYGTARYLKPAEFHEIRLHNWPYSDAGELDLHRPYVDAIFLRCRKCGGAAWRITEIFDSWTEAGSMPFAEYHHPFENEKLFRSRFPAQFVAEYIAQTRAWFYVMHVVSLILFGKAPFENVVTTGTILAEDGTKMSKSKGNFPDPWEVVRKYGADSLRFYLMSSSVMQADNLNFSVRDLEITHRRVVLILWNVYNYFAMYAPHASWLKRPAAPKKSLLDRWIEGRTQELVGKVTAHLDSYDTVRATRVIADYVDDLSRWYVRRSRGRRDVAFFATLHGCLLTISKVIAPFMPYLAEMLYGGLGRSSGKPASAESVHLTNWPKANRGLIDRKLFRGMETIRRLASLALAKRAEMGMRVRQPLGALKVKNVKAIEFEELLELLKEEVNVKEVVVDPKIKGEVELDTTITPELREEGLVRELVRNIQEMRRDAGLKPQRGIRVQVSPKQAAMAATGQAGDRGIEAVVERWKKFIQRETNARVIQIGGKKQFTVEREVRLDGAALWVGIRKV